MGYTDSQSGRSLRFWASLCARARSPSILRFSRLCPGKHPQLLLVPFPRRGVADRAPAAATEVSGTRPGTTMRHGSGRGSGAPTRPSAAQSARIGAPRKRGQPGRRADAGRESLRHGLRMGRKAGMYGRQPAPATRDGGGATSGGPTDKPEREDGAGRQARTSPRRRRSRGRRAKTAGGSGRMGWAGDNQQYARGRAAPAPATTDNTDLLTGAGFAGPEQHGWVQIQREAHNCFDTDNAVSGRALSVGRRTEQGGPADRTRRLSGEGRDRTRPVADG